MAAWAYVAHKDGYFGGAASGPAAGYIKAGDADTRDFIGKFIEDGWTVQPVKDRTEYEALMAALKNWPAPEQGDG